MEAIARIGNAAQLDRIGTDVRAPRRADPGLVVRIELAERVVALLQSGSNVLLRGKPGCGKTSLARSLASVSWRTRSALAQPNQQLRLVVDTVPSNAPLILETNAARFIEGCYYAHDLENKLTQALETARAKPAILFIDNVDELVGCGASSADPQTDVANLLVPHIDRGLRVVAATTLEGEARLRSSNARLHGRFVTVEVPDPSDDEAQEMLQLHLLALARDGAVISGDARSQAVEIARRYVPAEAAVSVAIRMSHRAAAAYSEVSPSTLRQAVADELGVLPQYVGAAAAPRHAEVTELLAASVFGQEQAVAEVADALVRHGTGLSEPGRPVASLLFAGPSGCGKTSLALACAEALTGSVDSVVRFDMSEYDDLFAVQRLLEDSDHSLVGRLRGRRAGVLLLDEIEKAHPAVVRLLLQALGESRLTGRNGATVRLDGFVVVLTTNVGARRWSYGQAEAKTVALVLADCSEEFPPEFRARLTRTLVFRPLTGAAAREIITRELDRIADTPGLADRGLQLLWPDALVEVMATLGVSAERGARGVQSVVRTLLLSPLARWLAENPQAQGGVVMVAPRLVAGRLESLAIDWWDESGFFAETLH